LHKILASKFQEQTIEEITEGLIKLNKTVTREAKHFGLWYNIKVQITAYEKPNFFVDAMVAGVGLLSTNRHRCNNYHRSTLVNTNQQLF